MKKYKEWFALVMFNCMFIFFIALFFALLYFSVKGLYKDLDDFNNALIEVNNIGKMINPNKNSQLIFYINYKDDYNYYSLYQFGENYNYLIENIKVGDKLQIWFREKSNYKREIIRIVNANKEILSMQEYFFKEKSELIISLFGLVSFIVLYFKGNKQIKKELSIFK